MLADLRIWADLWRLAHRASADGIPAVCRMVSVSAVGVRRAGLMQDCNWRADVRRAPRGGMSTTCVK